MLRSLIWIGVVVFASPSMAETQFGVDGSQFTINGKPTFLLGISYYGALGAADAFVDRDLDDMQRDGFNWLRVWATWAAFDNNLSVVNDDGSPREPYLGRLKRLVGECDRRGMIVDVTLSRQHGITGRPRLGSLEDHRRAVETLIEALKPYRNWYLDLGNERNIQDRRFVSFADLKVLRDRAKALDPSRLITASHSSGDEDLLGELDQYLGHVQVDFIAPHRGRYEGSAAETRAATQRCLARMRDLGRLAPVLYQEPFRRAYGDWHPSPEEFYQDLRGAVEGGAAGWCFHNGADGKQSPGGRGRSFDLREKRLYDQLDEVEADLVSRLKAIVKDRVP